MPHIELPPPPLPTTLYDDILRLPGSDGGEPITTPQQWAIKHADIRRRFIEILGEAPKDRPNPKVRVLSEELCDAYMRRRIAYSVEADEEAQAYLLLPHRARADSSAVLCLQASFRNGADVLVGLAEAREHWLAHDLAQRGFVCLVPDHFCCGARMALFKDWTTDVFYRKHPKWSALGKALWDEAIALDVLQAVPEVDPLRIGCIGASLGGHGSIFLAAYDERVAATVAMVGSTAWRADSHRMHWCRDYWYCYLPKLREGFLSGRIGTAEGVPIDMIAVAALIAPRPFLDIAAINDGNVGRESGYYVKDGWLRVSDAYDVVGKPENFAFVTHRHGHTLPEWTRVCAFSFLERHLSTNHEN